MTPRVNVHCHLLNFRVVPSKMVKRLAVIPEDLADDRWLGAAASALFALIPGTHYDRAKEFLKTFRRDLVLAAENLVDEYTNRASIDIFTPLLMDLSETPAGGGEFCCSYERQINIVSSIAAGHPWRMLPFVMFDPRREGSDDLCIDALENRGFLGVKMYPALGYHPDPEIIASTGVAGERSSDEDHSEPDLYAAERLDRMYRYCADHSIPITTHASTGGAYSTEATGDRRTQAWPLTNIENWEPILNSYSLRVNFAHFGGNYLHGHTKDVSKQWRAEIIELIRSTHHKGSDEPKATAYADVSYHDMALGGRHVDDYFDDLNALLTDEATRDGILFGTDAPMISHSWSEAAYVEPFDEHVSPEAQPYLFTHNPLRFLFGKDTSFPPRYIRFLEQRKPEALDELEPWITKDGDTFRVEPTQ